MSRFTGSFFLLFVIIFSISGCAPIPSAPKEAFRPSQMTPETSFAGNPTPESSLFYSLPLHKVNEQVTAGGYGISLDGLSFDDTAGTITLDLTITNTTNSLVDLGWAVQLRDGNGGLVKPQKGGKFPELLSSLPAETTFSGAWVYPQAADAEGQNPALLNVYEDYRLVFAPKGWSGPVIVYLLTP